MRLRYMWREKCRVALLKFLSLLYSKILFSYFYFLSVSYWCLLFYSIFVFSIFSEFSLGFVFFIRVFTLIL